MHRQRLEVDHKQHNPLFASWKLSKALIVSEHTISLPGKVLTTEHSTDYLSTRAAVLHNHITHQNGRIYLFCRSAGSITLQQEEQGALRCIWEVPQHLQDACASHSAAHDPYMQPSVVEVQPRDAAHAERHLFASSGQGDISLIDTAKHTSVGPCFPLDTASTALDAPFLHLEAAHQVQPGQFALIAWAIQKKSATQAAGCQVYAIRLAQRSDCLVVEGTQLLQVCALPPHHVTQPNCDTVVLATADPQPSLPEPDAAAIQSATGTVVDDDGDDIDPRTLRQAADRLAKFTSDQPADAIQQNEFADLYSEVGPDNVGGMGSEPSCTLTLFACQQGAAQSPNNGSAAPSQATEAVHSPSRDNPAILSLPADASGLQAASADTDLPTGPPSDATAKVTSKTVTPASADGNNATALDSCNVPGSQASQPPKRQKVTAEKHAPFEAVMQIGCSPHNVVASRPGHQQPMLLGLSDDVDCAVVAVSAADAGHQLHAEHVHSIPALAYVAAGKVHKKFVLLAHPDSSLAAAIIEGHRFCYIYRKTASKQGSGESQIIDMGVQQESKAVLGAALCWENGQDTLLVLTEAHMKLYSIQLDEKH